MKEHVFNLKFAICHLWRNNAKCAFLRMTMQVILSGQKNSQFSAKTKTLTAYISRMVNPILILFKSASTQFVNESNLILRCSSPLITFPKLKFIFLPNIKVLQADEEPYSLNGWPSLIRKYSFLEELLKDGNKMGPFQEKNS